MASNLIAMVSNLQAMASNLEADNYRTVIILSQGSTWMELGLSTTTCRGNRLCFINAAQDAERCDLLCDHLVNSAVFARSYEAHPWLRLAVTGPW